MIFLVRYASNASQPVSGGKTSVAGAPNTNGRVDEGSGAIVTRVASGSGKVAGWSTGRVSTVVV
jgi:hypothetical protein